MPRKLSEAEARSCGVTVNHEEMENGEKRFRLLFSDGSAYVRTETPQKSSWQNSHYHSYLHEMYIVQTGWMIYAEYDMSKQVSIYRKIGTGQFCVSLPQVPHNIFVSAGCKFHTVKFGDIAVNDWIAFEILDTITKSLSFDEALAKCEETGGYIRD
jgi:hypothetical protein